jgi:NAD(P)-dependent dehydrogenase (short-subunit alcohol dehydrogenase family)
MPRLDRQVVIITGASAGIGEAIARRLAREGATVVINARRADRLDMLRNDIEGAGGRALVVAGDITSEQYRSRLVKETLDAFGRIDVLVNNAGWGQRGPIEIVPLDAIRRNFETNFFALIGLTQLVIPIMREQRSGRIVNISSVAGKIARPLSSVYDSTKHALEAISDGLRGELAQFGIKVVVIEPGFIITEFLGVANNEARDVIERAGPYAKLFEHNASGTQRLRKFAGKPEDISDVVFKALTADNPHSRYAAPGHARLGLALKRFLPTRLFDYVLNR